MGQLGVDFYQTTWATCLVKVIYMHGRSYKQESISGHDVKYQVWIL